MSVGRIGPVAALVVGAFSAGGCSSSLSCASTPCPEVGPRLGYVMTVNGWSASIPKDDNLPSFRIRPGEHLVMRVAVTVPRHVTVTALWLGISTAPEGFGPKGPINLHPVLARSRQPLSAGSHAFGLRWRVPQRRPGASLLLVSAWSGQPPPADVAGAIAQLVLT
jgi:hypothetical protein